VSDRGEPHNSIAAALAALSGLSPEDHERDAGLIIGIDGAQIDHPKQAHERARRIRTAAAEIEKAISSMGGEMGALTGGILFSKHTPQKRPHGHQPLSRSAILAFVRALQDGARAAERSVDSQLSLHHSSHENTNLRRNMVAMLLSEIYYDITENEPPRGGPEGPFQRLLRITYTALGHPTNDLRGPLRAVHEFRKNRKSCD
jgi:hypothetical protein